MTWHNSHKAAFLFVFFGASPECMTPSRGRAIVDEDPDRNCVVTDLPLSRLQSPDRTESSADIH
jgi:hypothetical protein